MLTIESKNWKRKAKGKMSFLPCLKVDGAEEEKRK